MLRAQAAAGRRARRAGRVRARLRRRVRAASSSRRAEAALCSRALLSRTVDASRSSSTRAAGRRRRCEPGRPALREPLARRPSRSVRRAVAPLPARLARVAATPRRRLRLRRRGRRPRRLARRPDRCASAWTSSRCTCGRRRRACAAWPADVRAPALSRPAASTSSSPRCSCTTSTATRWPRCCAASYALARRALVVNDLRRARVPYVFGRVVFPLLFRSRVSVHDGLLSIRRAFTRRASCAPRSPPRACPTACRDPARLSLPAARGREEGAS